VKEQPERDPASSMVAQGREMFNRRYRELQGVRGLTWEQVRSLNRT